MALSGPVGPLPWESNLQESDLDCVPGTQRGLQPVRHPMWLSSEVVADRHNLATQPHGMSHWLQTTLSPSPLGVSRLVVQQSSTRRKPRWIDRRFLSEWSSVQVRSFLESFLLFFFSNWGLKKVLSLFDVKFCKVTNFLTVLNFVLSYFWKI